MSPESTSTDQLTGRETPPGPSATRAPDALTAYIGPPSKIPMEARWSLTPVAMSAHPNGPEGHCHRASRAAPRFPPASPSPPSPQFPSSPPFAHFPPLLDPETRLRAQARRLGLGERALGALLAAARSPLSRPCREALFAVALARTAQPGLRRASLDSFVEDWVRCRKRPGAQEAWAALATLGTFWRHLEDPHRRLVSRLLGSASPPPAELGRQLERLLATPRFQSSAQDSKKGALAALGSCCSPIPPPSPFSPYPPEPPAPCPHPASAGRAAEDRLRSA
ncbi:MAG: hypothetical protein RBU30_00955 [Polyangia bacterium]|jgi:hypothetical protein|nr:hypothetical protein [Polyangia bacterium]